MQVALFSPAGMLQSLTSSVSVEAAIVEFAEMIGADYSDCAGDLRGVVVTDEQATALEAWAQEGSPADQCPI